MKSSYKLTHLFILPVALFLFACTSPSESKLSKPVNVEFALQTIMENGKLGYRGIGGDIYGMIKPDLVVHPGDVVHITLRNGDGMPHDLSLPDFDAKTEYVKKIGEQSEIFFEINNMQPSSYAYYCTIPGHRQAGQEGELIVTED